MTDEQIERLARTHLTAGDDGEIFGVVKFARALLSASIADSRSRVPERVHSVSCEESAWMGAESHEGVRRTHRPARADRET